MFSSALMLVTRATSWPNLRFRLRSNLRLASLALRSSTNQPKSFCLKPDSQSDFKNSCISKSKKTRHLPLPGSSVRYKESDYPPLLISCANNCYSGQKPLGGSLATSTLSCSDNKDPTS